MVQVLSNQIAKLLLAKYENNSKYATKNYSWVRGVKLTGVSVSVQTGRVGAHSHDVGNNKKDAATCTRHGGKATREGEFTGICVHSGSVHGRQTVLYRLWTEYTLVREWTNS